MRLLTSRSLVQTQLGEILCAHHTDTAHSTHVHSVPHFFSLYIYSDTFFQAVQVCSLYQLHVRVDRVAGHFAACYQRILTIVLELFYRANILLTRCKKASFTCVRARSREWMLKLLGCRIVFLEPVAVNPKRKYISRFFLGFQHYTIHPEDCLINRSHGRFEQNRVETRRSVYW